MSNHSNSLRHYIVEKGVPMPQNVQELWANMEIGDSILFPSRISWEKFKKRAEIKQRVEFLPEFSGKLIAQRVWKIKEELPEDE